MTEEETTNSDSSPNEEHEQKQEQERNTIIDKMLTEQYNTSKRGEVYVGYNK